MIRLPFRLICGVRDVQDAVAREGGVTEQRHVIREGCTFEVGAELPETEDERHDSGIGQEVHGPNLGDDVLDLELLWRVERPGRVGRDEHDVMSGAVFTGGFEAAGEEAVGAAGEVDRAGEGDHDLALAERYDRDDAR